MKRYNTQEEFDFSPQLNGQYRAITVKANGGSVSLETWDGVEWVSSGDSWTEDGAYPVFTSNVRIRVTPTGGATYSWSN